MSVVAVKPRPIRDRSEEAADVLARRELRFLRLARRRVRVAVVGGGVAGLSAARELRSLGAEVVVIEDRDVSQTVSWNAAGLIEPVAGTRDAAGMARELAAFLRSMQVWRDFARRNAALISRRRVVTYCATSRPPLPWADAVDEFRPLPSSELHPLYADGEAATFSTYVVETSRWLMSMRARLAYQGVHFVRRRLVGLEEIPSVVGPVDGIVNASGLGAATLAGDATMYRGDGHVIRVRPVAGVNDVFMDETRAPALVAGDPLAANMLYIIPRRYDIVIGGTLWDNPDTEGKPQPVAGMREHLRAIAADVDPRLRHAEIIGYYVGARPRRHAGARVEVDASGAIPVAHCYGQGGSGWTLAPDLAEEAVGLLADSAWARRAA
jgi:glycine/D-amino acid oxidase-like deaminating enzyme